MNAAIKKEVRRLYDITPENVNGTAFGRKFVKGKPTPVQSVIFYVTEKKHAVADGEPRRAAVVRGRRHTWVVRY